MITIRIMLIGKTGSGKSTLGNAIVGKSTFDTKGQSMDSTTTSCQTDRAVIGDKNIVILDTPGVMGTNQDEEQIMKEIFKGTNYLRPGPHVFLLVIRADAKFTKEETKAVKLFSKVFGEDMSKYCIVVFTHKSALDTSNTTKENYLQKLPETFQQFKEFCIAIETRGKTKQVKKEVQQLLQVVEMKIQRNKDFYPYEKIKEMKKKYKGGIEAKRGPRAKVKEEVQETAGRAYEAAVDAVENVKDIVKKKAGALFGAVTGWMH